MTGAAVVALEREDVLGVEGREARDARDVELLERHADRLLRLGERALRVDVAARIFMSGCRLCATSRYSSPSWVNDTMSSGWFPNPSSATVRPVARAPGVMSDREKCTSGVHV